MWATRAPGGVQQTIELEQLYEDEARPGTARAVALIRRRWHWDEDGSEAGVDEMAWLFELRGNRVIAAGVPSRIGERGDARQRGFESHWIVADRRTIPAWSRSPQPTRRRPTPGAGRSSSVFVQVPRPRRRRPRRPRRRGDGGPSAATRRPRPRPRLRLRRHDPAARRAGRRRGRGVRGRRLRALHRAGPQGGRGPAPPTSASRSATCRSASSARASTTPSRGWG